ncbi:hypothetical protein BsWGS_23019 [Bradybaena similaris]
MPHASQPSDSANNPQPKDDPGLSLFSPVYNFVQPDVEIKQSFYTSTVGSDVDLGSLGRSEIRSSFKKTDEEGRHLRVSFQAVGRQISGMFLAGNALKISSDVDLQRGSLERENKLRANIIRTRRNAIRACILCCCCSLLALQCLSEACQEMESHNYDEAEHLIHKSRILIIIGVVMGIVMIIATVCSVIIVTLLVS